MPPSTTPGQTDLAALKRRTSISVRVFLIAVAAFGYCLYLYPSVLSDADSVGGDSPFVGLAKGGHQ